MKRIENYDGALVMVVEYLESNMSKQLLSMFPDNSPFDFDYTQSSIWSPLISRHYHSVNTRVDWSSGLSRNLFSGSAEKKKKNRTITQFTDKIKKKITDAVYDNLNKYQKTNAVAAPPTPSSNKLNSTTQTSKKGWGRMLKAASKQFKKKNKKKDYATSSHINLSTWDF